MVGRQEGHQACKKRVVGCWHGCLEQGADLHMAQLMPLPLTVSCSVKSRLILPFWYRLTRVVPEKGPLNGCVCVFHCRLFSPWTDYNDCRPLPFLPSSVFFCCIPLLQHALPLLFFLNFLSYGYCVNVLKVVSIDGLTPFLVAFRCTFLLWQINFFLPLCCQSFSVGWAAGRAPGL